MRGGSTLTGGTQLTSSIPSMSIWEASTTLFACALMIASCMSTRRRESSAIGSHMKKWQINMANQSVYQRMARISCLGKVHRAMNLILWAWAIKGSLFSRLSISRRTFRDTWWVKRPCYVPNHPKKMRTPTWPLKCSKISKITGPTTLSKWLT